MVGGGGAWFFGIPPSQSHSLIAGLTGAAIAVQGGLDAINGALEELQADGTLQSIVDKYIKAE